MNKKASRGGWVPAKSIKTGDSVNFGARQDGRLLIKLPEFTVHDEGHTLSLSADGIKISIDKLHPDYSKYAAHLSVSAPEAPAPAKGPAISKALVGNVRVVHIAARPHRYPLENYSRYSDGDELFVGPSTGKDAFAKLVKSNTVNGLSTVGWIKDRIVKVDQDKRVLELLNRHPGQMLLLRKDTLELKKALDF
jgi:hypothetical protein